MKVIDKLKARLAVVGATVDEYDNFICLDTPPGYVWSGNFCTSRHVDIANNGGQSWVTQAIRDETDFLAMGLDKVTDEVHLAQIRHDLDDDTWSAPSDAPEHLSV